jgi:simple sugar transport system permease protein
MNPIITFLSAAVVAGTPLLLATLGEIITEKSGNLNLGVEGMMLLGAVFGFMVGLKTSNPILAIAAAALAGAFGACNIWFFNYKLKSKSGCIRIDSYYIWNRCI